MIGIVIGTVACIVSFLLGIKYSISSKDFKDKFIPEPEIVTKIETVPKFLSPPEAKSYYRLKPVMGGMAVEEVKIDTIVQYEGKSYLTTKDKLAGTLFNTVNTYFRNEFDARAIDFVNLYLYHGLDKSRITDKKILQEISDSNNIYQDFAKFNLIEVVLIDCSEDISTLYESAEDAEAERLNRLLDL